MVIITGGAGSLGRAIVKELDGNCTVLDNSEFALYELEKDFNNLRCIYGDVRDRECLHGAFEGVDSVIHCAALKHVPICESNPSEAVKTNVLGSMNVIEECLDRNIRLIGVSTDKAVEPINTYGATKLLMEKLFLSAGYPIVRFGNFWGSKGSVIPLWEEQVKKGCITITDPDMKRYWISLEDAAKFVLKHLNSPKGIYIPEMKCLTLLELADIIAPDANHLIIGNRGGEKVEEKLK